MHPNLDPDIVIIIIKPHSMQALHRMWPVAKDVARSAVCLSVCVLVTRTY